MQIRFRTIISMVNSPKERGSVQPMAELFANESKCAIVKAGDEVKFTANIAMPEAAGEFVKAEWSFEGEQDYPYTAGEVNTWIEDGLFYASVSAVHCFEKSGVYFPTVRVNFQPKKRRCLH